MGTVDDGGSGHGAPRWCIGHARSDATFRADTARRACPDRLIQHLADAQWVVTAAPPEVNRAVAAAAAERGVFVNAVDDPAVATAFLGAVIRRGDVAIAISTGGVAPALAGLLREALAALLPDDLERWIDVARAASAEWKRAGVPIAERRPLLLRALEQLYSAERTS